MKKLGYSVAVAALAAFMATSAYAADVEVPVADVEDWTGFHIGVGGGANFALVEEEADAFINDTFSAPNLFAEGESFADLGEVGLFGTVEAGFDWQLSSIVIGALASYDFGKTKVESQGETSVNITNCGIAGCNQNSNSSFETSVKIGDAWYAGGRIGWLAMDSALIYVMGGYTEAKVKQEAEFAVSSTVGGSFSIDASQSSWESGYFVGGGIETLLSEHISLKGEYRYADYGKVKNENEESSENFEAGISQSSDITVHSVRAVLSFRF